LLVTVESRLRLAASAASDLPSTKYLLYDEGNRGIASLENLGTVLKHLISRRYLRHRRVWLNV
jgi:hypothetical protein